MAEDRSKGIVGLGFELASPIEVDSEGSHVVLQARKLKIDRCAHVKGRKIPIDVVCFFIHLHFLQSIKKLFTLWSVALLGFRSGWAIMICPSFTRIAFLVNDSLCAAIPLILPIPSKHQQ